MAQLHIRAGDVPLLIKKTAKGICGEFYDGARTDQFREQAQTQRQFVRLNWTYYVEDAVQSLAGLLALPGYSSAEKEIIAAAIIEYRNKTTELTPKLSTRSLN